MASNTPMWCYFFLIFHIWLLILSMVWHVQKNIIMPFEEVRLWVVRNNCLARDVFSVGCIDINRKSQKLMHLYHSTGLKLVVFRFFLYQNNRGSSGTYVTYIYCGLSIKIKCVKHCMARKDCGCIGLFLRAWSAKNLKTPNLSPMAEDAITRGGIGGLGSPMYIYGRLFTL